MAGSFEDALLRAGLIQETSKAKREREHAEEQRRVEAEIAEKLAAAEPLPSFEEPARGRIVESKPAAPVGETGRPEADDERVKGQMVWLHKSVPVLEIEGKPALSPDEIAAGRRR